MTAERGGYEFGDKNKNGQRVKIQGSQFIKREEKIKVKEMPRPPFIPKPPQK